MHLLANLRWLATASHRLAATRLDLSLLRNPLTDAAFRRLNDAATAKALVASPAVAFAPP